MPTNLHARSVLTIDDLTPAELRYLLKLAVELKAAKQAGTEQQRLKGRNIALIFERIRPAPAPVSRLRPMIKVPMSPTSAPAAAISATRNR